MMRDSLMAEGLVDNAESQETVLAESQELDGRKKLLSSALGVLNERERRIFQARRLVEDPVTLEELSTEFGISRERVRQIEGKALHKLRNPKYVKHLKVYLE